jgi:aldehyde dehydrogenase
LATYGTGSIRPSQATVKAGSVWTRDISRAYRMGRGIKAGRVWTNCYHQYPAHAAFGGYKVSGVGRETHKMMLDHYSQTKCMLVSYDPKPLGFF